MFGTSYSRARVAMSSLFCCLRGDSDRGSSSDSSGAGKGKGKEKETPHKAKPPRPDKGKGEGKGKDKEVWLPQRAFPFEFAYVDGWLLAEELDKIYGVGKYALESSNDRYILRAPRDLTKPEREQLLQRARAYYPERLSSESSSDDS